MLTRDTTKLSGFLARGRSRWRVAIAAALVYGATSSSFVRADSADSVRAEQLFRDGKQRMALADYAGACPLFAESFAVEPATGSLLALAACHEREGKLASAFREYNDVVQRSVVEQRADRQRVATNKASALQWKLSTLTIEPSAEVDGLEVRLNGKLLAGGQLRSAIPLDGGNQLVEVVAPAKKPWSTSVSLGDSNDAKRVEVPALEDVAPEPAPAAKLAAAPAPPHAKPNAPPSSGMSATRWAGIATLGVSAVMAVTGGVFVLRAMAKNSDSESGCYGDLCTLDARRDRLYARDAGNAATISFVVAGALAVSGVVLYIAGGQSSETRANPAVTATAWVAPGTAGGALHGSF